MVGGGWRKPKAGGLPEKKGARLCAAMSALVDLVVHVLVDMLVSLLLGRGGWGGHHDC